ncbi:hypothetical protein D9758_011008 [Tetrapyrgos nigripes]|uniref:Protein-serine/threonine kinase n=1 Tax=Tetrapyrgos nigripes TaxID=182062 RepID=A0A8H5GHD5_9AGAR|nr:hypothetical protein D9758_011008 [Tetrapyrgos nigripes]
MSAGFKISGALWDKIHHFASFPQTGVSLQQMVLFGQHPSQGTLLKASQFLHEELPVRLAHRVKELDELPHNLSQMPSIIKVKNWYAQSFEELIKFPPVPPLPPDIRKALIGSRSSSHSEDPYSLPESAPNPSLEYMQLTNDYANNNFPLLDGSGGAFNGNPSSSYQQQHQQSNGNGNGNNPFTKLKLRLPLERHYYSPSSSLSLMNISYPPQIHQYNNDFTGVLERIKSRHDPTVTTVAQGVLEWKKTQRQKRIGLDIQQFLDRFYLSRIGIRFLIGQHIALNTQESREDYVGIICTKANVHDIVQEAIENARVMVIDCGLTVLFSLFLLLYEPPPRLRLPRHHHFPLLHPNLNTPYASKCRRRR